MADSINEIFSGNFQLLMDFPPLPWQQSLFQRFLSNDIPQRLDIPTGLGKTAVIAIWLLALADNPKLPRRLVYVVNRRTVVDQTTNEVTKIRDNLEKYRKANANNVWFNDLAISTLRGQFADNREWSANPAVPAVITGTVDMIGSRMLFSGYGISFKTRPLHAGFLTQDALIVHDEAHLEPAFQTLLEKIEDEQSNGRTPDWKPIKVIELSATSRGQKVPLGLTDADYQNKIVLERTGAKKQIHLHANLDPRKLADEIADLAIASFKASGRTIIIFARKVEDVEKIVARLVKEKQKVRQLTGTMRGLERDALVKDEIFCRFLPESNRPENVIPAKGTVYLVCTSAGEVGVNISADHLISDLSTFDSTAQRLGRANRFGLLLDTQIHIFHPVDFDQKDKIDERLSRTFELLKQLDGDASPASLGRLDADARVAAFSPEPVILTATDILFDFWAFTTIKDKIPGRPPVEPYLHGLSEWEPPETQVAWRQEVDKVREDLLAEYPAAELLADYPLKPHELLRDRSDTRVFKHIVAIAERCPDEPAWLVDGDGKVAVLALSDLADPNKKDRINGMTILLSPKVGGLQSGLLNGNSREANDVADEIFETNTAGLIQRRRIRLWDVDKEKAGEMRLIRRIDFKSSDEEEEESKPCSWSWYERPFGGDDDGSKTARQPVLWETHVSDVVKNVTGILRDLQLPDNIKSAIVLAANFHDHGKRRILFQRSLGSPDLSKCYAKSGKGWKPRDITAYRHEYGSLLDIETDPEFTFISEADMRDLVLHLIAAHHGYARPHFDPDRAFDPEAKEPSRVEALAIEVPLRFARLQRKFGRWGLSYLESLLRAADYAASANPSKFEEVL